MKNNIITGIMKNIYKIKRLIKFFTIGNFFNKNIKCLIISKLCILSNFY